MKTIFSIICLLFCLTYFGQNTDAMGKKQGYWKKKDEKTNKLVYEGEFRDDKPFGKFKYYYPNDSIRAIMFFKDAGKTAYAKLFHLNGKRMGEGRYFNKEIKDSVWTYYDDSGILLSREKYKMGKKEGSAYVYFPDGGISEERNYKDDLQEGVFKQYFDAKRIRALGNYVKGQFEGRVSYYYPNGIEVAAGYYQNGQKNGPWIYRDEKGKIKDKELYKNGQLANKKETDAFFTKNKPEEAKAIKTSATNLKNNGPKPKTK
jgi:antitoxin component YwqK of YwqJK toxin-antitoxin module